MERTATMERIIVDIPTEKRCTANVLCLDALRQRNISTVENIITDIPVVARRTANALCMDALRQKNISTAGNIIMGISMEKSIQPVYGSGLHQGEKA
jgi:hypothetical protein